jgi:glyoxylase-like metal-dependent hydrolase (beta-lactamase superfamily II)
MKQPAPHPVMMTAKVVPIPLGFVNAYLVLDRRAVLVDAGEPGREARILEAVKAAGVAPRDLALIFLTHAHTDHVGSAAALHRETGAPLAIAEPDAAYLREGRSAPVVPRVAVMKLLAGVIARRPGPPAAEPARVLAGETSLAEFGVAGRALPTPGHTKGSATLLLDSGEALVGDAMNGGMPFPRGRPGRLVIAEDVEQARASQRLISSKNPTRVFVGHGDPRGFTGAQVRAFVTRA